MCDDRSKRMDDGSNKNNDDRSDENNDDGSDENNDDRSDENNDDGLDENVDGRSNENIDSGSNENVNGGSNENVDGGSNENVNNETDSRTDTNVENNGNNRINKSMKGNEVDSNDDERFKWINNNENEDFYRLSEVYKEFMTAITQHRLSDAAADSMLCIIRKYCTEPLSGFTRKGRMYMDQMDIKDFNIKMIDMVEFEGKIYKLQYRPIIDAIKSLEHDDNGNLVRVYFEQNSANWWRERQNPFRSTIFRQMQRKLEQCSFEYLLSPLLQKNGIYLAINGRIEHFTLHLSAILADMSEAQNICSILSNNATECSIHEYNNFFWKFQTNIYDATAIDRMHLQEIGTITPYNNLRILSKGYQQGVKFTGAEMRDVIKIIVFVLDELYAIDNGTSCIKLIKCYIKFIKMYKTSKKEKFNESELKSFEVIN
ncbi:unnamed protein product [Rhizophagus irregularis]|nr:unnamed protein product [Rhizophagus irregularis]